MHARSGLSGSFSTIWGVVASVGDMGLGGPWASDALMSSIFGCFEIYRLNLGFSSIFK